MAGEVAEQEPEADDDEEAPGGNLTGYVVSIVGRKRFRRLHHLAKRGMLPGTDYEEFVWYGEVLADPTLYDSICPRCWRQRAMTWRPQARQRAPHRLHQAVRRPPPFPLWNLSSGPAGNLASARWFARVAVDHVKRG